MEKSFKEQVLNIFPDAEVHHWIGWNGITSIYSESKREHLTLRHYRITDELLWESAWNNITQELLEKFER